ncbi:MAG: cytochrome P450 [Pararhizobium sp.]
MADIPRDHALDSSLAFRAEGYAFIGNRCRRYQSDIFRARLLGRMRFCVMGEDAARMFYAPDRFTRRGALPKATLHLLQDAGSVATLDDASHAARKAMFMAMMQPQQLGAATALAQAELIEASRRWPSGGEVLLHQAFRHILCRGVCRWAGLDLEDPTLSDLAEALGAMIDNAGRIGPPNWLARARRRRVEGMMRRIVRDIRRGRLSPDPESPAFVIARHEEAGGVTLDEAVAAVELLNILRPTVAVARFLTFGALALNDHPEMREAIGSDGRFLEAFVQEIRRCFPFFPVVSGIAREAFRWRDHTFRRGDRFILDLYGTNHDPRIWGDPETFRPQRFLGREIGAFGFIPQGGGSHDHGHRCAGEWLTIALMKTLLRTLVLRIDYDVPPQDLTVDLRRIPALPRSRFRISNPRLWPASRPV